VTGLLRSSSKLLDSFTPATVVGATRFCSFSPTQPEDTRNRGTDCAALDRASGVTSVTNMHRARGNIIWQKTTHSHQGRRPFDRAVILRHCAYTR